MLVRQIQVAVDAMEDRLVLRIGTAADEEIRVFFTRRFLCELWPHLTAMLAGHLGTRPLPPSAAEAADGMAAPSATFTEPFRAENPSFPLGSNPLLASEATLETAGEGLCRLILREARERSFTLKLNAELLQALCAMLRAAAEQAAWNLPLDYTLTATGTAQPGKQLLH